MSGDFTVATSFLWSNEWDRFPLWHVKEMVMILGSVSDVVGIERVGNAFTGLCI